MGLARKAAARIAWLFGWLIYVLDDPSILLKVGLCYCGHRENQHANDDGKECLICGARCPRFAIFTPPARPAEKRTHGHPDKTPALH
jgi:hypothetical protein